MGKFAVVICGAGIAGTEALLRLYRLCGDQLDLILLSPDEEMVCRPWAVVEPFGSAPAHRYSVARIAAHTGARWVCSSLAWVDRERRVVHTTAGEPLPYDALLLALGGRELTAPEHVLAITDRNAGAAYGRVLAAMDASELSSITFLVPAGPAWPLPLYEMALLTARHALDHELAVELAVVTPEPAPLHAFGSEAGEQVSNLLAAAGVRLLAGSRARVSDEGKVLVEPGGLALHPQRIVSVPRITGPNVRGIPGYAADRFLHVDEYCRVKDTGGRIFAAGDGTDLPVKHGGLGAQQADTAAVAIANLAGLGDAPEPLRPVIRAMFLTGDRPLYLSAYLIAGQGWRGEFYENPPWPLGQKIIGDELVTYLAAATAHNGNES